MSSEIGWHDWGDLHLKFSDFKETGAIGTILTRVCA